MVEVRELEDRDRPAWSHLWAGYLAFYETPLDAATTEATWARLRDDDPAMGGLAAVSEADVVGFAHYVVHPTTWDVRPVAYLEDLFVAVDARGAGVGRALIEALVGRARSRGWSQVHWVTAADNERARGLYRAVATETDWVRYEIDVEPA